MFSRLMWEYTQAQFYRPLVLYGLWRLARLKQPIISVFGGKRAVPGGVHAQQAYQVGQLLVQQGCSVLTGGGPGIMEAALCGAHDAYMSGPPVSMGIGVRGVDPTYASRCAQHMVRVGTMADRKLLLIRASRGFILFPGGYGTLNELSELIDLIKLNKMNYVPIVLMGRTFWEPYLAWITQSTEQGYIAEEYAHLYEVTDDVHEAVELVRPTLIV